LLIKERYNYKLPFKLLDLIKTTALEDINLETLNFTEEYKMVEKQRLQRSNFNTELLQELKKSYTVQSIIHFNDKDTVRRNSRFVVEKNAAWFGQEILNNTHPFLNLNNAAREGSILNVVRDKDGIFVAEVDNCVVYAVNNYEGCLFEGQNFINLEEKKTAYQIDTTDLGCWSFRFKEFTKDLLPLSPSFFTQIKQLTLDLNPTETSLPIASLLGRYRFIPSNNPGRFNLLPDMRLVPMEKKIANPRNKVLEFEEFKKTRGLSEDTDTIFDFSDITEPTRLKSKQIKKQQLAPNQPQLENKSTATNVAEIKSTSSQTEVYTKDEWMDYANYNPTAPVIVDEVYDQYSASTSNIDTKEEWMNYSNYNPTAPVIVDEVYDQYSASTSNVSKEASSSSKLSVGKRLLTTEELQTKKINEAEFPKVPDKMVSSSAVSLTTTPMAPQNEDVDEEKIEAMEAMIAITALTIEIKNPTGFMFAFFRRRKKIEPQPSKFTFEEWMHGVRTFLKEHTNLFEEVKQTALSSVLISQLNYFLAAYDKQGLDLSQYWLIIGLYTTTIIGLKYNAPLVLYVFFCKLASVQNVLLPFIFQGLLTTFYFSEAVKVGSGELFVIEYIFNTLISFLTQTLVTSIRNDCLKIIAILKPWFNKFKHWFKKKFFK
jgi:hypothetical protein